MKIYRSALHTAFARMLDDLIEPGTLLSHSDLADDWAATGLRADDLDAVLESLYASKYLDRTASGSETWYRVTTQGAIELRICRADFWKRWRDRMTLWRARLRAAAPRQRRITQARRTTDRVAGAGS